MITTTNGNLELRELLQEVNEMMLTFRKLEIDIEKKNNQLRAENACVKTANFPFIKTLDDFEFDFQPGINRKEMLELGNLGFIDRKGNILFVGSSGVGKTHLATASL